MLVKVYNTLEIIGSSTVEHMLYFAGYPESLVRTLKRPFTKVIKLPDGMLIRQKTKLSATEYGYVYVLVREGEELFSYRTLRKVVRLAALLDKICVLKPKEAKDGS